MAAFIALTGTVTEPLLTATLAAEMTCRAGWFSLPYTAVETSPGELGRLAVQALVQRMASPQAAGAPRVELVAPASPTRGSIR